MQEVKLFDDSEKKGTQNIVIDEEKWMVVHHDGSEISLSLENWLKLISLANTLLVQTGNFHV